MLRYRCLMGLLLGLSIAASAEPVPGKPPVAGAHLPPPLSSALKRFSTDAVAGKYYLRTQGVSNGPQVCSIPLVGVPRNALPRGFDRMPRPRLHSLDQNQVPPPAPPCKWEARSLPRIPAPK